MPCDQIRLNQVDLNCADARFLLAALKAIGATNVRIAGNRVYFSVEGENLEIRDGKLICQQGSEGIADQIKVAYSRAAVKFSAAQAGWNVKETKTNVFELVPLH